MRLLLVVGIVVLSPLRAMAATIPVLIAHDAAIQLTATARVETRPSLGPEQGGVPEYVYEDARFRYDSPSKPPVVACAGFVHPYDETLTLGERREQAEGLIYDASAAPTAAEGAGGLASNIANGPRLAQQLAGAEARSMFTATGELTPEAIQGATRIIDGRKLEKPALIQELTSDGSSMAEWGKYSTDTFRTPSGPAQVHFYFNETSGAANFTFDFKTIFNNQGAW